MFNVLSTTSPAGSTVRLVSAALSLFLLATTPSWAQVRVPSTTTAPPRTRASTTGDGLRTIKNDKIEIGIDLNYGGAITYMAFLDNRGGQASTKNMVNNTDLGRQAQIALYGGPQDYSKNGAPTWVGLGWNPIQSGDTYGNPSQVVAFEKQDNLLYVKCIPKQFALNSLPGEATIEHWLRLDGNVVKVHARAVLFRSDKTKYDARQQEMPCMYLNGNYRNIYYYRGSEPFTNGGVDKISANPPTTTVTFSDIYPTEPWMASLNDNNYGVGLYVPGNYDWKKGFFGTYLAEGEFEDPSSYVGAVNFMILDHDIVHEWDYEFILGSLSEIRSHINAQPRMPFGPNYRFDTSRKGWYYYTAKDTGWPIQGKLNVQLNNFPNDHIKSPFVGWPGRDVPKIVIRAALTNTASTDPDATFRLSWRRSADEAILRTPDRFVNFPVKNDGQFHNYTIDLSTNSNWRNYIIGQIELQANPDGPRVNGSLQIEWIAMSENGPANEVQPPAVDPPVVVNPPVEPPVVVIPPVTPPVEPPVVVIPPVSPPVTGEPPVTPPVTPPVAVNPPVNPPPVVVNPPVAANPSAPQPCVPGCLQISVEQKRFVRTGNR